MTSKERILACWGGKKSDHIPLTTQCFGFKPKEELIWERNGKPVKFWYTKRLEHIHTLPVTWEIEDDFNRFFTWRSLGLDDIIDVSIPWSIDPEVTWEDSIIQRGKERDNPVMVREYSTPSGKLRHAVEKTGEDIKEGWVIQPDCVPLIEDYNIPRAVEHAVSKPEDIPIIKHLYSPPDKKAVEWFNRRMEKVDAFSREHSSAVQAWTSFGMDAIVAMTGAEGAIMMAMDDPQSFSKLVDIVAETDYARAELACTSPAIDLIIQRGWYSGTDFWSPKLFDEFVCPHLSSFVELAHKHNKKAGYVLTTGVNIMGESLLRAGIDVLFYIDPIQDSITLEKVRDMFCGQITVVGGINSLTLNSKDKLEIEDKVKHAIDVLGSTNRFILHPVNSLYPDTPWEGVEMLIEAWDKYKD